MHKKKFTDEQQGLVALLPKGLPKLTDGAKLVLANIILWYGTEQAKIDGFIYRSNTDMMKDTGIGSKSTLTQSYRELQLKGLLTMRRGQFGNRKNASEYRLSDEILDKINFKSETVPQFAQSVPQISQSVPQFDIINQLIEQNKYLIHKVNELSTKIDMLYETPKCTTNQSKCTTICSKCTTESDTESDTEKEKEKNKRNMVHEAEVATGEVDTNSAEVDKASAYKHSSSFLIFEEEKASAHEASANKPISADEIEHLPWEVVDEVKPISGEVKPISADTSTLSDKCSKADVISTSLNEDLSAADRLTYPQCLDNALTPQIALPPLSHEVDNFISRVKTTIRKGVYDWSLTLDDMPDYLTGDDINSVVAPALRQQPDVNDYLGLFRISDLSSFAQDLMENRLKNKDIPTIIRQNRFEKKHSNSSVNDDEVLDNDNEVAPDAQINQSLTVEPSTKNDDDIDEDLPF